MSKRIGFIGVGLMGHGMAANLLTKGYPVMAMAHRNRARIDDLIAKGATEGENPAAIAAASDIVILCVTGAPQVETVAFGKSGLVEGAGEGLIVIDCSTSEPATTERLVEALDAKGAVLADAPLARTPKEAEEGRLNTMVGASEDLFHEIKPVLETFCENIFHVGDVGAGHKTKLIYNFITMGHASIIAEALCACAATGVDAEKFSDVVAAGGANSGIYQLIVPKAIGDGDTSGLQFSLTNAAKDLHYYTRMTEAARLTGNVGNAVHHALVQGMNLGFEESYVGDLIPTQEKLNGVAILKR